jgi:Transposase, Mutator family
MVDFIAVAPFFTDEPSVGRRPRQFFLCASRSCAGVDASAIPQLMQRRRDAVSICFNCTAPMSLSRAMIEVNRMAARMTSLTTADLPHACRRPSCRPPDAAWKWKAEPGAPHGDEIPASERTREELRDLIEGRLASSDERSALLRLATRLIVEEALEAEVGDALGRGYYAHGAAPGAGYRNGYRSGRLKTADGPIAYAAPQGADRDAPFRSALRAGLQGRTAALKDLAVELFARGLSTRDIADAFTDDDGRPLLSRAAVSQLRERLWAEYQTFASRNLAEHDIVYLFVDGIAERLRPGQRREPVLAA